MHWPIMIIIVKNLHILQLHVQSTPDNSNLQGKSKKVRVIGSFSYQEFKKNSRE